MSTGSREPASASRPASRPNLDGLGVGLGHPCLGLGLGGSGLDYNPDSSVSKTIYIENIMDGLFACLNFV